MIKKGIQIILLALCLGSASAQEDASYAMYIFNNLYFNPAYTGSNDGLSANAIYRHQWSFLENAPKSFTLGIHAPLKNERFALGLHANNDRLGITIMNSVMATFAYRIPMNFGKNARFSIGIQAGFKHFNHNFREVNATLPVNDPVFQQNLAAFTPNAGLGIQLKSDDYIIGLSVPNLIANQVSTFNNQNNVITKFEIADIPVWASAGYVFTVNKFIKIKPYVLAKYSRAQPLNIDFNLGFHLAETFYIGGLFRYNNSGGIIAALDLSKQWRVGYAYELSSWNSVKGANRGTHEFMLSFDINHPKTSKTCKCRVINPRQYRYF
ncbi:MAG: type IX secretion system membrane protein PorP/SprF [Bacteroidetes bacterium]|nr:type IX secretion system membrane protein PorP/SprF [Bacteroidota bacterium]